MADSTPVHVVVRPDGLTASLRAPGGRDRADVCRELCAALLDEAGVTGKAINWERVDAFVDECRAAAPDEAIEREVAQGTAPKPGAPGRMEIEVLERAEPERGDRAVERTDHKANRLIRVVRAGERLGIVVDPEDGEDGESVLGKAIAASRSGARAVKIHPSLQRRGNELFAARSGVLREDKQGVRVLERYHVSGCVDYSTGNLALPCDLRVGEGVRDDFVVDVEGSVEIGGLVEGATVRARRDASLKGGMAARGKGSLTVGRDLTARYLDQVDGEVMRDARVDREIVNCRIAVGRNLTVARGQIIGGEVAVAGLCEVDTVGSDAGVATRLIIGRSAKVEALLERMREVRERVDARREKLDREHTQLTTLSGPKLTAQQAERTTELRYELSMLNGFLQKIDSSCTAMLGAVRPVAVGRLKVSGRIHAKATLVIGPYTASFRRELRGPALISLDAHGRPIVTNLLDDSVVRLSEVAMVEHDKDAVTVLAPAA